MDKFTAFMDHWQTLMGSILGGIFALLTAFVVASSAARTTRRTAATLLAVDLMSVLSVAEHLKSSAKEAGVAEAQYPLWLSEQMNWRRPKLSQAFDGYAAALAGVHDGLSAHLSLLKLVYTGIEDHLRRIENDAEDRRTSAPVRIPRPVQATNSDAKVVADGLELAGAHAECAIHFLDQLVFSRKPAAISPRRAH